MEQPRRGRSRGAGKSRAGGRAAAADHLSRRAAFLRAGAGAAAARGARGGGHAQPRPGQLHAAAVRGRPGHAGGRLRRPRQPRQRRGAAPRAGAGGGAGPLRSLHGDRARSRLAAHGGGAAEHDEHTCPTAAGAGRDLQWSRSTTETKPFFEAPGRNSLASAGVSLSWNIFNGLSTTANVRKAEIQVALAENDLANGRRSVASDVEKAVAQLSTARAQARVAKEAEQTAREGLRLARTRQEVGVGTQLEVRDAELKLTQAQLNVVGSLVDGREAESALRRAQGG
ncbi:MAG: TolC family protein [Deltaproteobacteria bacterium]|nr:MAG: TolC family protein [Deltaproteobacteria bacterium]